MHTAQYSTIKMIRIHLKSGSWRYYHWRFGNAGTSLGAFGLNNVKPSINVVSVVQDLYTPLRLISAHHTEIIDRL
jgi:hypothetical protein